MHKTNSDWITFYSSRRSSSQNLLIKKLQRAEVDIFTVQPEKKTHFSFIFQRWVQIAIRLLTIRVCIKCEMPVAVHFHILMISFRHLTFYPNVSNWSQQTKQINKAQKKSGLCNAPNWNVKNEILWHFRMFCQNKPSTEYWVCNILIRCDDFGFQLLHSASFCVGAQSNTLFFFATYFLNFRFEHQFNLKFSVFHLHGFNLLFPFWYGKSVLWICLPLEFGYG